MLKRTILSIGLMAVLVFQAACGPLSRLNDILPYIPAAIDFAVSHGRISADLGAKLKDDTSSGTQAVTAVKQCLDNNVKSDAQCYLEFGDAWRAIIGRNHVQEANDPKITLIFNLASQLVDLVVRKNTQPAGVRGTQNFDKQIDTKLKELEREVKNP